MHNRTDNTDMRTRYVSSKDLCRHITDERKKKKKKH